MVLRSKDGTLGGRGEVIRGAIFDLDGTLFEGDYDWPAIKRQLGVDRPDGSILDHLRSLPPEERERKEKLLESIEDRATSAGRLRPGAAALLDDLRREGLKLAMVTNNRRENVERILGRYGLHFDVVVTRESGHFKPSGSPLLLAARKLDLTPEELVAVGDSEFDLRAGREAGMGSVIIVGSEADRFEGRCDLIARDLIELRSRVTELLPQERGEGGGRGETDSGNP